MGANRLPSFNQHQANPFGPQPQGGICIRTKGGLTGDEIQERHSVLSGLLTNTHSESRNREPFGCTV
jgi:hypothetical protein